MSFLRFVAATLVAAVALPTVAGAQVILSPVRISVAGGVLGASPGSRGRGTASAAVTFGAPIVHLAGGVPQVTYAYALDGSGRDQLIGESVRHFGLNGAYAGVGAGVGLLATAGATGAVARAVVGTLVATDTALEARAGLRRGAGSGSVSTHFGVL